jgi:ABC-2 type transport system ATP-binding protein
MDEADRCNEIAFMTQGRIILRDTPAGMKRRVPGRVVEVSVNDYRSAMAFARSLPFVRSVEVSGEILRVLVNQDAAETATEDLRNALAGQGFVVEHARSAPTDLEMAFATLIPAAGELPRSDDEQILAVHE